jgi:putative peptidoglycan lipid II flippase
VGLLFYSALKILQPAFYAIEKRWFPMMVSILALLMNLALNYTFVFILGWDHSALAMTTSITASVNFIILYLVMRKFAGDLGTVGLLGLVGKLACAGALMGAVCLAANRLFFTDLAGTALLIKIASLGATVAVAAAVYFAIAKILRVAEAEEALGLITRRLRR